MALPYRAKERIDAALSKLRNDPLALAAWLLPVALIVYLSLRGGGYDLIPRSEVGILVWWALLLGVAVGTLTISPIRRPARWVLLVALALVAWTALSLGWTESAERTAAELARLATYLGVLALALAIQRGGRWRSLFSGITVGLTAVVALAVLSRLQPEWFPQNELGKYLQGIEIERRLAYPLGYSSALGTLAALTLPLLLASTSSARSLAVEALAAALFPVAALAFYLTSSGTATLALATGLLVFLVLAPDRLPKLAMLAAGAAGGGILAAAVDQREALDRGLSTPAAASQGHEVLALTIFVCAGVALCQLGIGLAARYGRRPAWLVISRRGAAWATAGALLLALSVSIAAGVPGEASDRWRDFKGREGEPAGGNRTQQILDVSSSGRYQFWEAAVDANESEPLLGIGPGTFEFWWARNGLYAGFVRDAHSLYLETLAELGVIGFLLIGGLVVGVLATGAVRASRAPPDLRVAVAAATAACASFAAAAAVDWIWEIATLPVAFFLLAALVLDGGGVSGAAPASGTRRGRPNRAAVRRRATAWRAGTVALSIAALVVIAIPLRGATALRASQREFSEGRLDESLSEAQDAASIQPYAATPRLLEALVLERQRQLDEAATAAREATSKERTNWRTWLILSRIEAERGRTDASLSAYRQARRLNPRSGVLAP
jgi:hypothetical protein